MRRLIVPALLVLAGCGEGDEQVRATLDADRRAADRQDWKAMCALRTEAARLEFAVCAPKPSTDAALANEAIVVFLIKVPAVDDIDVDGARATARHDDGSTTRLRKVDGRWLIDTDGDDAQIRATLAAYDRALAAGDRDSMCALMTDAAQRELLRHDPSGCGATPEPGAFGISEAELIQELGDLQRVEVDGDTAEARYDRSVTTLRKVDGRWLVD